MARKSKRRTRVRTQRYRYTEYSASDGSIRFDTIYYPVYDTFNDWTVKPCNMSRVTRSIFSGVILRAPTFFVIGEERPCYPWINPEVTMSVWTPFINNFKHKKLPTSNQADLLTNLAEFDDTVAMLATSFKTKPSYGGAKWGWMPLISDIIATNDAANKCKEASLSGGTITSKYSANFGIQKNSVVIPYYGGTFRHEWDVKVKFRGHVSYENDILAYYDFVGFHPSPKLAWDLVPLSFALDWVLPIGDILKDLSTRVSGHKGWVKSVNFTGWRVITAKCTEVCLTPPKDYAGCFYHASEVGNITYVTRDFLNGVALEQKTIPPSIDALKTPTWEQAFDLTYLSEAFYQRGKKLLAPHVYKKKRKGT